MHCLYGSESMINDFLNCSCGGRCCSSAVHLSLFDVLVVECSTFKTSVFSSSWCSPDPYCFSSRNFQPYIVSFIKKRVSRDCCLKKSFVDFCLLCQVNYKNISLGRLCRMSKNVVICSSHKAQQNSNVLCFFHNAHFLIVMC